MTNVKNRNKSDGGERRRRESSLYYSDYEENSYGKPSSKSKRRDYTTYDEDVLDNSNAKKKRRDYEAYDDLNDDYESSSRRKNRSGEAYPQYGDFFEKELTPEDPNCETESVFMSKLNNSRATFYSSKHNDDRISHSEKNKYVRGEHSEERKIYNTQKMFSSREINKRLEKKVGYDDDSVIIVHRHGDDGRNTGDDYDKGYKNRENSSISVKNLEDSNLQAVSGFDVDKSFELAMGAKVSQIMDSPAHNDDYDYREQSNDDYYRNNYNRNDYGYNNRNKNDYNKNERNRDYYYEAYDDDDPRLPDSVRDMRKKKKRKKTLAIILAIVGAIVVALAIFAVTSISGAKALKAKAYTLKDEFGAVVECIGNKDTAGAEEASARADEIIDEIETTLQGARWKIASILPIVGNDVKAVGKVVDLVEQTNDEIIKPLLTLTESYPLDGLKVGDGFNVSLINVYLDFLEDITPKVTEIDAGFDGIKFNVLDSDGKMTTYLDKVHSLLDKFQIISENMPFIRAMLGDGSDRLYALVPQNNAEIRAAGGFPGIVGSITITDGIMSIGEFEGVTQGGFNRWYDYEEAGITAQDEEIFCDWICNSYDASFIADFPKCGKVWSIAYRDAHDYATVDGTVSMLPQVIQKILALLGQDLTLSDGTVLTGDNATKVLVHDLYYQYITTEVTYNEGNEIVDALLKEAAASAMHMFVSEFSLGNASEYFQFFMDCFADKTIQIWLADEAGQQTIVDVGASGQLNADPNNPVGGAYYSSCDTSKDGWFLDIITTVSEPVINADNSRTYDVTVTYSNTMDWDTYLAAPDTLVSYLDGSMMGHIQIFGPAGGTIDDVSVSDGTVLSYQVYKDLDCLYYQNFVIPQGEPITIYLKMTTAPGVTTPLTMTTTPTLTNYR